MGGDGSGKRKGLALALARSLTSFQRNNFETIVEPISDNEIGMRLFRIGIGRRARVEIYEMMRLILEANPCILSTKNGTYDDIDHLMSIPLKGSTNVPIEARAIATGLPKGLARTILGRAQEIYRNHNSVEVIAGLSQKELAARSGYYPTIHILEMSACDRGCPHCSNLSGPNMKGAGFDDIMRAFDVLPPSPFGLLCTGGEPMMFTGTYKGRRMNLGDVFTHLFERFPQMPYIGAVTSGINFEKPLEAEAAESIRSLPEDAKARIRLHISLSDFPYMRKEHAALMMESARMHEAEVLEDARSLHGEAGAGPELPEDARKSIEKARAAQIATMRFAIENGFRIGFNSFFAFRRYKDEFAIPLCRQLFPSMDPKVIETFTFPDHYMRAPGPIGRWAAMEGRYLTDGISIEEDPSCHGYCGIRLPKGMKRSDISSGKRIPVPIELALSRGGDLGIGCCNVGSYHAVISNIHEGRRQIKEDTLAFMRRIRRIQEKGVGLKCMECIGQADHIREPGRFRKIVGPENMGIVTAERLRRR